MRALFLIAKLVTPLIPVKTVRRDARRSFRSFVHGWRAYHYGTVAEGIEFLTQMIIDRATEIGNGCSIGCPMISDEGRAGIGHDVHFTLGILTQTQNYDNDHGDRLPYGADSIENPVSIEDYVLAGQRVMILAGTHIGRSAIVQAGAGVRGEVLPLAIVGWNPAKQFASRDAEHFYVRNVSEEA